MTTTTTGSETITIVMSERRPIKIDPKVWPVIARADWHDGKVECQANQVRCIRVRESADGLRRLVYGSHEEGNGGHWAGFRPSHAGYLLSRTEFEAREMEAETVRAIRRVAGVIGDDALGDECIADLPAERLA